jgi:hypothetical protein
VELIVIDELLLSTSSWFANNEPLGRSQCIPGTLMSKRCCLLSLVVNNIQIDVWESMAYLK